MARAISQIISDLDQAYAPQRAAYQQQIDQLPAYQQTQQAGLDQAKTNAFSDINSNANSKGMFYSGMPINEQAKYVGSTYLPAVAKLAQDTSNQRFSLQNALAGITQNEYGQAQTTRTQEQANDISAAKAASSGGGRSGGGGSGKASMQEIIDYWKTAPSQYGNYNANGTNLHRWQAAASALADAGYSIVHNSAADKLLRSVFNQGR